jgi:hypothetical protein
MYAEMDRFMPEFNEDVIVRDAEGEEAFHVRRDAATVRVGAVNNGGEIIVRYLL